MGTAQIALLGQVQVKGGQGGDGRLPSRPVVVQQAGLTQLVQVGQHVCPHVRRSLPVALGDGDGDVSDGVAPVAQPDNLIADWVDHRPTRCFGV